MKVETVAKRLAEKTETPILEHVILGKVCLEALPAQCMIWKGATRVPKDRPYPTKRRYFQARTGIREEYWYIQKPVPIIQFQKERHAVHRLIFQLIVKPTYEFVLRRVCGNSLCVNPTHYSVDRIEPSAPPLNPEPVEGGPAACDDDWTLQEASEMVEIYLAHGHQPRSFEEASVHNLLVDVPNDLLRQAFLLAGKKHLT